MIVLIQNAWWEGAEILDLVAPRHAKLCKQNGWRYILDYGQSNQWRFELIRAALDDKATSQVISMDSDSVLMMAAAPDLDGFDAGLVPSGQLLHAGTLYLNNTHEARAYVSRCEAASKAHKPDDFPKFFSDEVAQAKIKRLSPVWDDWPRASGPRHGPTIVKSFHKLPREEKLSQIKALLKELE